MGVGFADDAPKTLMPGRCRAASAMSRARLGGFAMSRLSRTAVGFVTAALFATLSVGTGSAPDDDPPPSPPQEARPAGVVIDASQERPGIVMRPADLPAPPWRLRRDARLSHHLDEYGNPDPLVSIRAWEFRRSMPNAPRGHEIDQADPQSVSGSTWVNIGPSAIDAGKGVLWAGRINAIAFDPTDPHGATIYIGAGGGGVWKAETGGDKWKPLTDFEKNTNISHVVVDPDYPQIVYVATGDYETRSRWRRFGFGVLRSTDGGVTWDPPLGAAHFGTWEIARLALDPTSVSSPSVNRKIHAAASNGVSYSTDGGATWQFADYQLGTALRRMDCNASDVVVDPLDASTVFAACRGSGLYRSDDGGGTYYAVQDETQRLPTTGFDRISLGIGVVATPTERTVLYAAFGDTTVAGSLKGFWRTENGGNTWQRLTGHPPGFAAGTWSTGATLESASNDSEATADVISGWIDNRVIVEGQISGTNDIDYFRLTAAGNTTHVEILAWRANASPRLEPNVRILNAQGDTLKSGPTTVNNKDEKDLRMRFFTEPGQDYYVVVEGSGVTTGRYQLSAISTFLDCQCRYDLEVGVAPNDADNVFLGMVDIWRSTDGGDTFSRVSPNREGWNYVHADVHDIVFDPSDTTEQTVWVACDGGLWRSIDLGDHWYSRNPVTLSTSMIYEGIAQHPTQDMMVIGTQDDGTLRYDGTGWQYVGDNDGGYASIVSNTIWYQSNIFQRLRRRNPTEAENWTEGLSKTSGVPHITPFVMDPNQGDTLLASGGAGDSPGNRVFNVYRTTDSTKPDWSAQDSTDFPQAVFSIAFSPSDHTGGGATRTYYAGTAGGQVWGTDDTGASWTELTAGWAQQPNARVLDIAVHPTDPKSIVIVHDGAHQGRHVFRKTSWTASWQDITPTNAAGSPLSIPVYAVLIDPGYPDTIFIGTENGIYRTTDGGATWTSYSHGLPNVTVKDLVMETGVGTGGVLRAATYGRGIWEIGPGNTTCDDAFAIGDGHFTGSTAKASVDGSAKCGYSYNSPDVYYSYSATCDGTLELDTCGSGFDTVLSVHSACPASSGNQIFKACNDNCPSGGNSCDKRSCLKLDVDYGQEYVVRLAGSNKASGPYNLDVDCVVPNDTCSDAEKVYVPSSTFGSTRGADVDSAPLCDGITPTGSGIWYRVVGSGNTMTASLCNLSTPSWDTRISVYCGGCGGLSCVAANDDASTCAPLSEVSWCSEANKVYHILVHGKGTVENQIQLYVNDGLPCGVAAGCSPANDTCATSVTLAGAPGEPGDNTDATTGGSASCATSNSDLWYTFVSDYHGQAVFSTCDGSPGLSDTVVSVLGGCDDELACNDDIESGVVCSEVAVPVAAGSERTIRVAGYGSDTTQGSFELGVTETVAELVVAAPGLYTLDGAAGNDGLLFRLEPFDRTASIVGTLGFPAPQGIAGTSYASNIGVLYGIDDQVTQSEIVSIDPHTGLATPLIPVPYTGIRGLAWDPERLLLWGALDDGDSLITINPASGEGRYIGSFGFSQIEALAFDPGTRRLYGADQGLDVLVEIDTATGAATQIGPFGPLYDQIEGLAFDTVTGTLYGIQQGPSDEGVLVVIDTATGSVVAERGNHADVAPRALAFIPGLADAIQDQDYEQPLLVAGGRPRYQFDDVSGLPPGLEEDDDGVVHGAPTDVVSTDVEFNVTDDDGRSVFAATLPLRVRPRNDACPDAVAAGEGETFFMTISAATDGPDEPGVCDFFSHTEVGGDVWYCHEATQSGSLTVDVCASDYDTKLAVYDGCGCPQSPAAVACNDDECGAQSRLTIDVTAGREYLIRIGGYQEARGSGTLLLGYDGRPAGSCCRDGGCVFEPQFECEEGAGTFLGEGTRCEQDDTDGDAVPDVCESCPFDTHKTNPGICGCSAPDVDQDGDGLYDCEDDDVDGDGVPDEIDADPADASRCADTDFDGCDDCSSRFGPDSWNDGIDEDLDGFCNVGDCDDGDPTVWRLPGVENLHWLPDPAKSDLAWDADPGSESTTYTLYRVPALLGPSPVFECIEGDLPSTAASDATAPPAGDCFYYVVNGQNRCGSGSAGQASDGTPRATAGCP